MNMSTYRTKRDVAVDLLREAIVRGELPPGARLMLEELSQRYDISMTPIREAFSVLESEGLIALAPHRGAVVTAPDRDELLELYAIRGAIEELATRHGVPRLSDADLADLRQLFDRLDAFEGDWEAFLDVDKQFHRVIYRAAGSSRWLETIETLWQRSRRYMLASTAANGAAALQAEHAAILAACQSRDAERAAAAIRAHLKQSETRLLQRWSE
jgi:DNA-binding GntR family transcriptional regulator